MKTIIVRSLALSLAASLMATHSPAQKADAKNEMAAKISYNQAANKTSFSNKTESVIKPSATVPYNKKVFQEFQKKFLNATNVKWTLAQNGSYHASFMKDGSQSDILFKKNGKIIYLINYLSVSQLPADIKSMIKNDYDEFKISTVAKISDNTHSVWIVSLTGLNHHIMVKVDEGEMEEINRFELSN